MSVEIQIELFNLLDEIAEIAKINEKEEDPDKHFLNLDQIQKKLNIFTENFLIQIFEAFGMTIDYMADDTCSKLRRYFSKYKGKFPKNMLDIFNELYDVVEDMEDDVYLESAQADQTVYYAYFTFLPRLFDAVNKDEGALSEQISNFSIVKVRMEGILIKIGAVKAQLALT